MPNPTRLLTTLGLLFTSLSAFAYVDTSWVITRGQDSKTFLEFHQVEVCRADDHELKLNLIYDHSNIVGVYALQFQSATLKMELLDKTAKDDCIDVTILTGEPLGKNAVTVISYDQSK